MCAPSIRDHSIDRGRWMPEMAEYLPEPLVPARLPPFYELLLWLGLWRSATPRGLLHRGRAGVRGWHHPSSLGLLACYRLSVLGHTDWAGVRRSSRRSDGARGHRIFRRLLALHRVTQPLLGLLAGCNGVIALLLGLLPAVPLDRQFVLHPLERLFDNLHLAFHTTDRLPVRDALMGQLGLEVVGRRLSLLEKVFRALSGLDLLPQSLPRCVELVGVGTIVLIPVKDRDRNLAIADETPTLWR